MNITLSTHVLNLETGKPVDNLSVTLSNENGREIARERTDNDGRIPIFPNLDEGTFELCFETGMWFRETYRDLPDSFFYPEVRIRFIVNSSQTHYHVPLLLNRYGYSTYRGS